MFDEKLTIARILGLSLDWRDMNFNSALRQFSFEVLKFKKLEEMKQEHQEELENLICACEVHELSYNSFFNEETFELLSNFRSGTDAEIKFANKTLTLIMRKCGHLRNLPLKVLQLALDLEVRYLELSIDSEFQMDGSNMIEMAETHSKT
ncbi:MAG: hypothetical protein IPK55_11350 [Streptococcus sp.]|nr:hypothetical protein [Streptococcus sp.]